MSADAVQEWGVKVKELLRNRYHLVPRSWSKERQLVAELEALHEQMTAHERLSIRYPPPPVDPDIIAHDDRGHLYGFEFCECPIESTGS